MKRPEKGFASGTGINEDTVTDVIPKVDYDAYL